VAAYSGVGGLYRAAEERVVHALLGGPIIGFAVGYTAAKMKPTREEWRGWIAAAILIVVAMISSAALAWLAFRLSVKG